MVARAVEEIRVASVQYGRGLCIGLTASIDDCGMETIALLVTHGMIEIPKFDGGNYIRANRLARYQKVSVNLEA